MADKKFSKPAPSKKIHPATPIIVLFVIFLLLGSIFVRLGAYISGRQSLQAFLHELWLFLNGKASFSDVIGYTGSSFLISLFFFLKVLSVVISVLLLWFIFSTVRKLNKINKGIWEKLHEGEDKVSEGDTSEAPLRYVNPKWQKVSEHINSDNPGDWKLAILEADIILDEMLDKMGYRGDTMGEKLKTIEPSDFLTLNSAWEAHKIRNLIAHEGSDFLINRREADRVIALYKEVFEEFKFI